MRSSAKRGRLAKAHSDHNRIGSGYLTVKNIRCAFLPPFRFHISHKSVRAILFFMFDSTAAEKSSISVSVGSHAAQVTPALQVVTVQQK